MTNVICVFATLKTHLPPPPPRPILEFFCQYHREWSPKRFVIHHGIYNLWKATGFFPNLMQYIPLCLWNVFRNKWFSALSNTTVFLFVYDHHQAISTIFKLKVKCNEYPSSAFYLAVWWMYTYCILPYFKIWCWWSDDGHRPPKHVAVSKYNVVVFDGLVNGLFLNTMLHQTVSPRAVWLAVCFVVKTPLIL